MIIENHKVVSVSYTLSASDGAGTPEELIEETEPGHPFVFLFGGGGLLEAFEANLRGLKTGDLFDFRLTDVEGYGSRMADHLIELPKSAFTDDQGFFDEEVIVVGNMLPMTDSDGNRLQGMVSSITDEAVTMDFNHPLAGKHLHFSGSVLDIRLASEEEISHGHVHGPGGHHH
jgi:FKBP-type peptidyl-prolyl cis-trans isomerase SlyD